MRSILTVWALALYVIPSAAAEIAVTYTVDQGKLRQAAAGTALTFEIHADSVCSTPVYTEVVPVETVSLIEKVRTLRVRGAPQAPRVARLHHVLADAPIVETYFLHVTGTGISPVGGVVIRAVAEQVRFDLEMSGIDRVGALRLVRTVGAQLAHEVARGRVEKVVLALVRFGTGGDGGRQSEESEGEGGSQDGATGSGRTHAIVGCYGW